MFGICEGQFWPPGNAVSPPGFRELCVCLFQVKNFISDLEKAVGNGEDVQLEFNEVVDKNNATNACKKLQPKSLETLSLLDVKQLVEALERVGVKLPFFFPLRRCHKETCCLASLRMGSGDMGCDCHAQGRDFRRWAMDCQGRDLQHVDEFAGAFDLGR